MQVNVLIVMPSPERRSARMKEEASASSLVETESEGKGKEVESRRVVGGESGEEEQLGEYVIGTARIAWDESGLGGD